MVIIDVRERDEFEAQHVPGSIFCPLSQLDMIIPGLLQNMKESEIAIMCRSGNRAKIALETISSMPTHHHKFTVYEGGIQRWIKEGHPVTRSNSVLPLMRQVHIAASLMIISGFVGEHFYPGSINLALLVGVGLALSGFFGICLMMKLLAKMPWNKKSLLACEVEAPAKKDCCG